jgi:homoserine O-acetyltransferase/O-succinyltransferase
MQALSWALEAPDEVDSAVVVAASSRLSAQNIAFSAVAREAIMRDPNFQDGATTAPGAARTSGCPWPG